MPKKCLNRKLLTYIIVIEAPFFCYDYLHYNYTEQHNRTMDESSRPEGEGDGPSVNTPPPVIAMARTIPNAPKATAGVSFLDALKKNKAPPAGVVAVTVAIEHNAKE